ncbi:SCO2521 family protein [Nocardia sp. NBC_01009]|uniref:SCO2521 family protein n=1 Tax=Nocardia sp. NBC_01009 TaxID=2975996 RepID=UPI00386DBCBF|nr:SCO2521 family protein [Nocardia sp. NBC_01009]
MADAMVLPERTLIVLGEVRTCLVPASGALSRVEVRNLLALKPGRPVRSWERPIPMAISPTMLVGVDCLLATGTGAKAEARGTVATDAVVVGGRVLQSSVRTAVVRAARPQREKWEHYLRRGGVTEVINKIRSDIGIDLVHGFLHRPMGPDTLDLGSISERLLARVRLDRGLDQRSPLLTGSTRLQWTARLGAVEVPHVEFRLEDEEVRTVQITVRDIEDLAVAQQFCADLAMHDWLLTAVVNAVEEADRYDTASPDSARVLAAVLEHLAHLWMPGAHTPPPFLGLWQQLELRPGFTRDWDSRVGQLRNRLSVATLAALREAKVSTTNW